MVRCQSCRFIHFEEKLVGFERSSKPLLILMRYLGIPLNFESSKQRGHWWIITGLGIFYFFLHVECYSIFLVNCLFGNSDSSFVDSVKSTFALIWNSRIDFVNGYVLYVGSHLTAMLFLLTNWCHLANNLKCLEQGLYYTTSNFKRFQATFVKGLIATVVVSFTPKHFVVKLNNKMFDL